MATTDAVVTLTEAAVSKIKELLASESEEQALRIAVTGGGCSGFQYCLLYTSDAADEGLGCSGFQYAPGFDTEQHADDVVLEQQGVRVFVDEVSAEYLAGAHVDFQDGLNGKGFAIENPNSTGSCGCGQSFSC